ncbi:MAG: cobalt ECF transporter T component CbiQ [Desertimonas sp.]
MSGGHSHAGFAHLHVPGTTALHRLAPEAALAGLVAFAVVVAVTPRRHVGAFALEALILIAVIATARLRPSLVARRLLVIAPFAMLAVLMPFVGGGERIGVAGVALSTEGLWASWNLLAKATLGATASIVFAATTPLPEVLTGLTRLHVPRVVTAIVGFMFRYLELLGDQLRRMRTAMVARGHDPRWLWQVRPLASSVGTLFVRSYEQGERTHHAMVARGYDGSMPELNQRRARPAEWALALAPALMAAAGVGLSLGGLGVVR